MYDMLRKYMEGGKMYEHGGEHGDPTGKTTSKGFRIIPTKAEGGFDKLSYYIDGQPMSAEDFRGRYYDAGNTPENLQNLIRNMKDNWVGAVQASLLVNTGKAWKKEMCIQKKAAQALILYTMRERTLLKI